MLDIAHFHRKFCRVFACLRSPSLSLGLSCCINNHLIKSIKCIEISIECNILLYSLHFVLI